MKISIVRTIAADEFAEICPYTARVEIETATMDRGTVYEVPVLVRHHGLNKTFHVDVFGFGLETKKPQELAPEIKRTLLGLVNASRLPTYVFIARRAKAVFPVYTIGDEVVAMTNDGPVFRHVELAKVREYLTDFLHDAKILGEHGKSDKLHVRGISRHTLGLRRPVMYFKKRIDGKDEFWAPVFQASNGRSIYAYAASDRQEVQRQNEEVLELHGLVAKALQADNRLDIPYNLRADRLMPSYWERLEKTLLHIGQINVGDNVFELYKNNTLYIAVENREEEDRYGLYFGKSEQDAKSRIEDDYARRGKI